MVTVLWAAKGGSGTTVVASALALRSAQPALLVDLAGEIPAVLGLPEPDRPGVADWLHSASPVDQLAELLIEIDDRRWLLPWRSSVTAAPDVDHGSPRWSELAEWLATWSNQRGHHITIDAGTGDPPGGLLGHDTRALLVTRPCYLALRRAVRSSVRPTGVVLVEEPGRALSSRDVEYAVGAPVEATVSVDPAIARAVDAGLLASRLPRVISRELRRVAA